MGLKGRAGLEKHIESLVKMNAQLSSDARNLAEALRGENKVAGNWGEAVFHRILEACGFKEGVHFRSQASYADSDGERKRLVPDFVIDLPGGRSIVVDSKLSLLSYSDYCSSQTPESKRANLDRFKKSVRAHLREFSGKYNEPPRRPWRVQADVYAGSSPPTSSPCPPTPRCSKTPTPRMSSS